MLTGQKLFSKPLSGRENVLKQYFPVMRARGVNVRFRKRRTFATEPDYDRFAAKSDIPGQLETTKIQQYQKVKSYWGVSCLLGRKF